jgi:hypothetical protein
MDMVAAKVAEMAAAVAATFAPSERRQLHEFADKPDRDVRSKPFANSAPSAYNAKILDGGWPSLRANRAAPTPATDRAVAGPEKPRSDHPSDHRSDHFSVEKWRWNGVLG